MLTGDNPASERDGAELLSASGELIRADIRCSSCGKFGARVVRTAKSRASKAVLRQAHFRFVDPYGGDAHHPFCEFHGDDENRSAQASLLDFGSEKSTETRAVRLLVCKGIEQKLFDQRRIQELRQWFFDLKSAGRFTLTTSPEAISWTRALHRHPSYQRWTFHPAQAEMPAFNWKAAAKSQFTEDHQHLFDLIKGIPIDDGICDKRESSFGSTMSARCSILPYSSATTMRRSRLLPSSLRLAGSILVRSARSTIG
ncbi:hypothetical protein [Bradyrhizobium sp. 151]|uniref:hypothetical protein n=1 Tax=Bradyrhizobium sp. 151 TaxID=2782626 RepID=UPI001FF9F650|nr:hypothetical protein [Bradyrhizobium sp. 151]